MKEDEQEKPDWSTSLFGRRKEIRVCGENEEGLQRKLWAAAEAVLEMCMSRYGPTPGG